MLVVKGTTLIQLPLLRAIHNQGKTLFVTAVELTERMICDFYLDSTLAVPVRSPQRYQSARLIFQNCSGHRYLLFGQFPVVLFDRFANSGQRLHAVGRHTLGLRESLRSSYPFAQSAIGRTWQSAHR
jgi:hypothetical protein